MLDGTGVECLNIRASTQVVRSSTLVVEQAVGWQ